MRCLFKLKEDLGADAIAVCVAGKEARVTVMARHGGQDIAQTAAFSVETLTAFIGDPWLIVREGLREFAAANATDEGRGIPRPSPSDCSQGGTL
jgi:hypothetical protein